MQRIEEAIPPQIRFDDHVTFIDPFNDCYPIHLDCVNSLAVFRALLSARFPKFAQEKLGRGEFIFRDMQTRNLIDLCQPWRLCLFPGQTVEMRVMFELIGPSTIDSCMVCHGSLVASEAGDLAWFV